jgi:hypothetical protein
VNEENDEAPLPEYIWGVDKIIPTLNLDASDIIDQAVEGQEDLCPADFNGFAEFNEAVKRFVGLNKDFRSWYASGKVAVLLK